MGEGETLYVEHAHRRRGLGSGWRGWSSHRGLRAVLAFVVCTGLATAVAVAALWPTGEGTAEAMANADRIGLVTDRFGATVQEIRDGPCSYSSDDNPFYCRSVTVVLDEGPAQGSAIALPEFDLAFAETAPPLAVDQKVILGYEQATDFYFYADTDRRTPLAWLTALFAVFVIALGRRRGVLALVGMAVTLAVLVAFLAPSVLDGNDPLLVAVVAASAIAFVSLYLAHGFNSITTVALAGTLSALGLTLALFVGLLRVRRLHRTGHRRGPGPAPHRRRSGRSLPDPGRSGHRRARRVGRRHRDPGRSGSRTSIIATPP